MLLSQFESILVGRESNQMGNVPTNKVSAALTLRLEAPDLDAMGSFLLDCGPPHAHRSVGTA